ncbi:MAG: OadG family protein [Acutalibacteraceae bacterium]|jgi:Na+-transporting methylmalonyl-CoA/oxaloacetate decarboxylase gamma subunit|nr:OadG family protein [Clostridiales bacterium]
MLAGKDLSMIDALTISLTGILMVFTELVLLAFAVVIISKVVGAFSKGKNSSKTTDNTTNSKSDAVPLPETQSRGEIDLIDVSQEDAAVIMAIVSNKSGIPLNRLVFNSIKLLEEE